jgi:hypothetical protein
MVQACSAPDRKVNDDRNGEWITRLRDSGLTLKKFAANLADENKQLRDDIARYKAGDLEAHWSAMRADVTLFERGPWASTDATTIERQVRRLRKQGIDSHPRGPFSGTPIQRLKATPRGALLKEVFSKLSKKEIQRITAIPRAQRSKEIFSKLSKEEIQRIKALPTAQQSVGWLRTQFSDPALADISKEDVRDVLEIFDSLFGRQ